VASSEEDARANKKSGADSRHLLSFDSKKYAGTFPRMEKIGLVLLEKRSCPEAIRKI
jgi:hypothetical protein